MFIVSAGSFCPHELVPSAAELGDYDMMKHPDGYVGRFQIIPKQSIDFDERVMQLHQSLAGKTTAEAEYYFLAEARK